MKKRISATSEILFVDWTIRFWLDGTFYFVCSTLKTRNTRFRESPKKQTYLKIQQKTPLENYSSTTLKIISLDFFSLPLFSSWSMFTLIEKEERKRGRHLDAPGLQARPLTFPFLFCHRGRRGCWGWGCWEDELDEIFSVTTGIHSSLD